MRTGSPSALEAIDHGCESVRRCAGWAGVLALSALPARLLLVLLFWEAWKLGDAAGTRGDALLTLAWLAFAAWLVALAGRLVFIRACRIAAESERPAPMVVLRVPAAWLWALIRSAVLIEAAFWLTIPALILAPLWLGLAGMCAVQAPDVGPGVRAPLRTLATRTPKLALTRLLLCFIPALAIAIFAVVQGAGIAAWAADALPGVEPGTWSTLLTWQDPLFIMLACAGGSLLVEPFWLAALVALDRQARSRSTGEDLRAWAASLRVGRQSRLLSVLLAFLLLSPALAGEALTPAVWRERLDAIDQDLAAGHATEAQKAADGLRHLQVAWPERPGTADPGLSAAIRRGEVPRARRLLAALRQTVPEAADAPTIIDNCRLAELDANRRSRVLAEGGEIGSPDLSLPESPWLERLGDRLAEWGEAIGAWLRKLFSGRDPSSAGMGGAVWAWIAAGVAVALLAALAVASMRRKPPILHQAAPSTRGGADEALSMAADAWLVEGTRLLAAGEQRAAVRAWYLGLLAATWERGLLHHRTGWTNWDYVRALPRTWDGGAPFSDLTARFDQVWYGGRDDPRGAAAFGADARTLIDGLRRREAR